MPIMTLMVLHQSQRSMTTDATTSFYTELIFPLSVNLHTRSKPQHAADGLAALSAFNEDRSMLNSHCVTPLGTSTECCKSKEENSLHAQGLAAVLSFYVQLLRTAKLFPATECVVLRSSIKTRTKTLGQTLSPAQKVRTQVKDSDSTCQAHVLQVTAVAIASNMLCKLWVADPRITCLRLAKPFFFG
eukprot:6486138-Amphidinium_carterae.8